MVHIIVTRDKKRTFLLALYTVYICSFIYFICIADISFYMITLYDTQFRNKAQV